MSRRTGSAKLVRRVFHHPADESPETQGILELIERHGVADHFTVTQWRPGLQFYRRRLDGLGATGDTLVDLGCGTGNWSLAAAATFNEVVGIDVRQDRLDAARALARHLEIENCSFLEGDITALPLKDDCADFVVLCNVLYVIPHWTEVIREVRRILKSGGRAYISWADFGVQPYYLAQAVADRDPGRFLSVSKMCAKGMVSRLRTRGRVSPGYLKKSWVKEHIQRCGLQIVMETGSQSWPRSLERFMSERIWLWPYWHELLVERQ